MEGKELEKAGKEERVRLERKQQDVTVKQETI